MVLETGELLENEIRRVRGNAPAISQDSKPEKDSSHRVNNLRVANWGVNY